MRWAGEDTTGRRSSPRLWLLGAVVAVVLPTILAGSTDASWSSVAAAVVVAVGAALVASRRSTCFAVPIAMPRKRERHDSAAARGGPATDPVHHPLRPRAPGLV